MCLDRFYAEHFAFHLNSFVKEDFIILLEGHPVIGPFSSYSFVKKRVRNMGEFQNLNFISGTVKDWGNSENSWHNLF